MNTLCPECRHDALVHHIYSSVGCCECDEDGDSVCNCKLSDGDVYRLLLSNRDAALAEARKVIEPFAKTGKEVDWQDDTFLSDELQFSYNDLRAAAAWLAKNGGE